MTQRLSGLDSRSDGVPGTQRRGIRRGSVPHEVKEFGNRQYVGVAVSISIPYYREGFVTVGVVVGSLIPQPNNASFTIPEILDPALRTDDGIVAPIVGGCSDIADRRQKPLIPCA